MLNLTNLSCWEAGSIVNNAVMILCRSGNIYIVSYSENFQGANPLSFVDLVFAAASTASGFKLGSSLMTGKGMLQGMLKQHRYVDKVLSFVVLVFAAAATTSGFKLGSSLMTGEGVLQGMLKQPGYVE